MRKRLDIRSNFPVAVVTGANRGLGREVVRQLAALDFTVVLGSRNASNGEVAARELDPRQEHVFACQLDVADASSVYAMAAWVTETMGTADVLVNNAAITYDTASFATTVELSTVRDALETNLLGAWATAHALLPLLRRSDHPRIVNVSSEGGSISEMTGGTPAYSVSKAAINALTRLLAGELRRHNILVNSICPGWTATDMGGGGGRPVAAEF